MASWKLKGTYFCIGLYFFLGGVEYAVILPTCWLYVSERFGAEQYFFGIVMSAFQFTGLFAGPVMGKWSDTTRKTKPVILFSNLWEIGGNVMYFLGFSKWFILAARLVSGVGTGAGAAIMAELARASDVGERTRWLSTFMSIRQFGLIIGPAFNLFLRELNFKIGTFVVDKYTAPGLLMAVLWSIHQLLVLFLYRELPGLVKEEKLRRQLPGILDTRVSEVDVLHGSTTSSVNSNSSGMRYHEFDSSRSHVRPASPNPQPVSQEQQHQQSRIRQHVARNGAPAIPGSRVSQRDLTSSSQLIEGAERLMTGSSETNSDVFSLPPPISASRERLDEREEEREQSSETEPRRSYSWSYYYDEFMRDEIIALLFLVFISYFAQMGLETMITPLAQKYLNWGELENSIFYSIAGVQILLVFVVVLFLSKRLRDRTMILIGSLLIFASFIFDIIVLPPADPADRVNNWWRLITGVFLDLAGLPFMVVCVVSLYSKITRDETQGLAQGLRRSAGGMGTILGPLWAGALMHQLYFMLGVFVAGSALALVLLMASFDRLKEPDTQTTAEDPAPNTSQTPDERTPLLGNTDSGVR